MSKNITLVIGNVYSIPTGSGTKRHNARLVGFYHGQGSFVYVGDTKTDRRAGKGTYAPTDMVRKARKVRTVKRFGVPVGKVAVETVLS